MIQPKRLLELIEESQVNEKIILHDYLGFEYDIIGLCWDRKKECFVAIDIDHKEIPLYEFDESHLEV